MAYREYERFCWKFRQLWAAGAAADLYVSTKDGHAKIQLSLGLGTPWSQPTAIYHPPPRHNPRTTPTTPSPRTPRAPSSPAPPPPPPPLPPSSPSPSTTPSPSSSPTPHTTPTPTNTVKKRKWTRDHTVNFEVEPVLDEALEESPSSSSRWMESTTWTWRGQARWRR